MERCWAQPRAAMKAAWMAQQSSLFSHKHIDQPHLSPAHSYHAFIKIDSEQIQWARLFAYVDLLPNLALNLSQRFKSNNLPQQRTH
jgi:hypothetical protein